MFELDRMPALEIFALNTENVRSTRMTILTTANANRDILENIAIPAVRKVALKASDFRHTFVIVV